MSEFTVRNEEKWLHQNRAEYVDTFEGCLMDNHMFACKRGYCAVYEIPRNEWQSIHLFRFAPYRDEEAVEKLWSEWLDEKESVQLAQWMNELAYARRSA